MSTTASIDDFLRRVEEVGLFPQAALEIMAISQSETATVGELEDAVSMDSVLAGRILQVANSPLMGRRSKIGTLRHAVQMLGFSGTRDMAVALAASAIAQPDVALSRKLWEHAEGTAWLCRALSQNARGVEADAMFVAGLLHDLGMQLLLALESRRTQMLMAKFDPHNVLILKAEQLHFGFTHAELGAGCLRKWGLPAKTVELVEFHHAPVHHPGRFADVRSRAILQLSDAGSKPLLRGEPAEDILRLLEHHPAFPEAHIRPSAALRALEELAASHEEISGSV